MHVGLNLIYLVPGQTGGMETYARELIPRLEGRSGVKITAFVNAEGYGEPGPWHDVRLVRVPVRGQRRTEWVRGEQLLLPRLAARADVELLHSLGSTSPARGPYCRVTTIHDVIYRVFPEAHSPIRARAMRLLIPLSARRSRRIIAPSENTRSDLVRLLHVPESKIDVIPLGVGSYRVPATDETTLRASLQLQGRAIVLTTSAKRPHKNLVALLDAWALLPEETRPVLVLPGYPTAHEEELRRHARTLGLAADTRFLDWISPAELEGLYDIASCFVFPSLYEGFGLPVLEAMARGVPVACSDRGSLAEVAGDAAVVFDAGSPKAIARAVERILGDATLTADLIRAGHMRSERFTWEATAEATLRTYERALASLE